jgi:hypothetical protein
MQLPLSYIMVCILYRVADHTKMWIEWVREWVSEWKTFWESLKRFTYNLLNIIFKYFPYRISAVGDAVGYAHHLVGFDWLIDWLVGWCQCKRENGCQQIQHSDQLLVFVEIHLVFLITVSLLSPSVINKHKICLFLCFYWPLCRSLMRTKYVATL